MDDTAARSAGAPDVTTAPRPDDWVRDHHEQLEPFRSRRFAALADEVEFDRALLRALYDAGLSRRGWPASAGGLGGDERDRASLYDALTRADVPLPEAFVLLETLAPVLVHYAPELAVTHLPAYLRGDELWGQGFSEPDAGSDLAAIRTRAVDGPDGLVLDGQKVWTTLGQFAQWGMVLARTDPEEKPHRGLSMLWVDLTAPGAEVRPIRAANGRDEFAEMHFSGVVVPPEHVIGGPGRGWEIAMYLLQFERGMYAWERQAALHRSLRRGLRAGPRASADAVAATGRAFASLTALRLRSAGTVRRLAAHETIGPEASIDKLLLSRAERHTHEALRLLDPAAFLTGDGPADVTARQKWFYSRASAIFGGAAEVQRSIVAERLLGLPKEARGGR